MKDSLDPYSGREPAKVKHYFLRHYLGRLIHKTASVFDEIVYVDGFAGPWKSRTERFEDTSFGIALGELSKAKESWKHLKGRDVRMSAHLVEKDPAAYQHLHNLEPLYPSVHITPYQGEFLALAKALAAVIPRSAFAFFFIDPKGWSIDMKALEPLISRPRSEVVFNFMFDFINRFALMPDPVLGAGLDRLMPVGDWRTRLQAIEENSLIENRPKARETALIEAFKATVSEVGRYDYVAHVPVLRATKDRTLYFLVYGTRSSAGIEVFRDCQISALEVQSNVRGTAKVQASIAATGQFELLESLHQMGPDRISPNREAERSAAAERMVEMVHSSSRPLRWKDIWPTLLARHVVKLSELNAIANRHRKSGRLKFPDWPSGTKRKPEDHYLVIS